MNKIKLLRKQNNIRQVDFCKQIGVSQAALSGYETGRFQPDFDVLIKIAEYFNVSIDYLLENEKKTTHIEQSLNDEQQRLAALAKSLSDDELNDVIDYVNFVKSKRN